MENNIILELNKLTKKLMINDAFWGMFLSGIPKSEDNTIPTICVSLNKATFDYSIKFNSEWWNQWSDEIKYSLLLHEGSHLAYLHMLMSDIMPNGRMANIAMDAEINQRIKTALPKDGIFIDELRQKYPQLDWKPLAGAKHYYDELNKLPEEEKDKLGISDNAKHIWVIIDANGESVDSNTLTEGEKNAVRIQIESTIEQIAEEVQKSQGHIPADISQMIKGFVKPKPKFNYKKYIKNYIGNSTKYIIGTSRLRENARFPDSPKTVLKPLNRILVLVDESGSVSENELLDFMNEIHHLSKKNDICIRPFDTEVMKEVKYAGKGTFKRTNCGGTSFTAAVDFYNQNKEYTSCLIFTDGHAEVPPKCFKRLLWVISSNGSIESIKSHAPYIKIPVD